MNITLVVAQARNRVIGRANALPWHLSEDLRHFKALTLGRPVVMGRRTWESIGRPLPGRTNIVVTTNVEIPLPAGVLRAASLEAALILAQRVVTRDGVDECMVIGGGEIFRQALPLATRVELTDIELEVEGDAYFPDLPGTEWEERACTEGTGAAEPHLRYRFRTLERRGGAR